MINREVNPSRYIVQSSWYKYGNEDVKPYKIRIQPPLPNNSQKTRRYYESKLDAYPDVIDVAAVVDFTGFHLGAWFMMDTFLSDDVPLESFLEG